MSLKYSVKIIKTTVKLLKEYESQKILCATEFIDSKNLEDLPVEVSTLYLSLTKHQKFFDDLHSHFLEQFQLKKSNTWTIKSLLYLLIFVLADSNYEEIKLVFKNIQYKLTLKIVEFLIPEENLVLCARIGCKYFDNDYILMNVIRPLLDKEKLLQCMVKDLSYEHNAKTNVLPKKITKPVPPTCFTVKKIPSPPINTPVVSVTNFKAQKMPNFKKLSEKLEKSLDEEKDKNKNKALELLAPAQNCPIKCATVKEKVLIQETEKSTFKSTKLAKFKKNVLVKKNTAALMREAAVLSKDRENEIKKLEELLNGSFDNSKIDAIEEEIRKERDKQTIQDIERKHLEGLLTFEEAHLAKKKVLQANQEKMAKFKEERLKILEEISAWKEQEQEKIRGLVEKCQNIEKSAKEAEKRLLDEKQCRAKLIDYESKMILREIHEKREQELAEKAKLIQELRALQQLRSLDVKEFDPTECPNFGFLCEMSIAELRERLDMLKIEMREELEERRRAIEKERQRKELLIDNVKEFISQSRMSKPRAVPNSPPKLEQTAEIAALRERLQQARELNAVK